MATIDPTEGRRLFGRDPSGYYNARLSYPHRVFDILQKRCGLRPGTRTFEIGPGTGLATQRLLQLGASPLVVVEPDKRLASFLSANLGQTTSNMKVRVATFERVKLRLEWFDLGVSASAFHWVNEKVALPKIVHNLRQGGWWAMWWNLFSDGSRTDEFHKATRFLLQELDRSPSSATEQRPPFALDREQRIANLKAVNAFENIEAETISGTVLFGTERMMQLYSTLSPISRLEPVKRQRGDCRPAVRRQGGNSRSHPYIHGAAPLVLRCPDRATLSLGGVGHEPLPCRIIYSDCLQLSLSLLMYNSDRNIGS